MTPVRTATIMPASTNRFAPLLEDNKNDEVLEDTPIEGWDDAISVSSKTSKASIDSRETPGDSSKGTALKRVVKKRNQHLKKKLPQTLTPVFYCVQEIARLCIALAPTSLQKAAIKIGFPSKYFGSSPPHSSRRGGMSPTSQNTDDTSSLFLGVSPPNTGLSSASHFSTSQILLSGPPTTPSVTNPEQQHYTSSTQMLLTQLSSLPQDGTTVES
jgi:hypothetical protein